MLFLKVLKVVAVCSGLGSMALPAVAFGSVQATDAPTVRVPVPVVSLYQSKNSLVVGNPVLLSREDVFRTALSGLNGLEAASLGVLFESARSAQGTPSK